MRAVPDCPTGTSGFVLTPHLPTVPLRARRGASYCTCMHPYQLHPVGDAPSRTDHKPRIVARAQASPGGERVRVLTLHPGVSTAPEASTQANRAGAALGQLLFERDSAREEAAFLREQLASTRAYLAEVVEAELAAERAEREALLGELSILNDELQHRALAENVGDSAANGCQCAPHPPTNR